MLRELIEDASVSNEAARAALRARLRTRVQRVTSLDELRAAAKLTIGGDPISADPHLVTNQSAARRVLIDAIVERLVDGVVPHPDEEDEEDALPDDVLDAWLRGAADEWPSNAPPQPHSAAEALDPAGVFGMAARGVEVRPCTDTAKGRGVYALREFASGEFIGLYWGESLTQRAYAVRHGWRNGQIPTMLSDEERAGEDARRVRLAALTPELGAPMGGVDNGGSYIFALLIAATEPEALPAGLGRRPMYVDAEDGTRSSWCRYINHAHYETPACNLEPRSDPMLSIVWFEARRAIRVDEELCFSCACGLVSNTPTCVQLHCALTQKSISSLATADGMAFNDGFGKGDAGGGVSNWHAEQQQQQ